MSHFFYRTKLIYEISQTIAAQRNSLLADLVAYTQDPVRYNRRVRMLIQLATYEQQILQKVKDLTVHKDDLTDFLELVSQEVIAICDITS